MTFPTKDDRFWRCKVVRYTSTTRKSKPVRENLGLLVQAPDSGEAMARATAYFVNNGYFGRVLHSVEAREAASVELPMELKL